MPARALWRPLTPIGEFLHETGAAVLIQALPSSPEAHSRSIEESMTALLRGAHLVSATKNHFLSHWRELETAAQHGRSHILISGATGAALPVADLARLGVQGLGCQSVRACPNGTSTFVLDRMMEGQHLDVAMREAQRLGIAEEDMSADLSGTDAANKIRLLAGLLWGWDVAGILVEAEPIQESSVRLTLAASRADRKLRAVATASLDRPMKVRVALELVAPHDPLHQISGPEKAVSFHCPEAGDITVQGGRSSPAGAALAMVKDLLNLLRESSGGFR